VSHDREFLDNVVTSTLVLGDGGAVREYVGGYADWVRQAAAEAAHEKSRAAAAGAPRAAGAGAGKTAAQPAAASRPKPKKLSYKETRELEALPEKISELEMERETLHLTLADPNYYRTAKDAVARLTARLARLESELAEAYRRWEELEGQV
jgi:ATP-binding cassette subfamily F protein uup